MGFLFTAPRTLSFILAFSLAPVAIASAASTNLARTDLARLETQYQRAIQGVLANLEPSGAVIASPSQSEPNYFYHWSRDAALTMKVVTELAFDPKTRPETRALLTQKLDAWIRWESALQEQNKLTGLGEPRYNLNGTTNLDPWGRPQNDGPALRAITAIRIAEEWLNEGRIKEVESRLYAAVLPATTLIKRDLEYVAHHWREPSFDLWEEELAFHFYTLVAQKTALKKGAGLARRMNDLGAALFYESQAQEIERFLTQFSDGNTGTIRYAIQKVSGLPHKTQSLDIAVILAAIETFDGQFQMNAAPVVATLRGLIREFQSRYLINQVSTPGEALGPALGRYPEDIYDGAGFSGGNPWFLSTLAAAELYCDLAKTGAYSRSLAQSLAIPQFNRVLRHLNTSGDMNEQFNRQTGYEQGARHLTWSYAAYVTAYQACF
jgi:glucoamylase